jgi:hypothetical protein
MYIHTEQNLNFDNQRTTIIGMIKQLIISDLDSPVNERKKGS